MVVRSFSSEVGSDDVSDGHVACFFFFLLRSKGLFLEYVLRQCAVFRSDTAAVSTYFSRDRCLA